MLAPCQRRQALLPPFPSPLLQQIVSCVSVLALLRLHLEHLLLAAHHRLFRLLHPLIVYSGDSLQLFSTLHRQWLHLLTRLRQV